MQYFVSINQQVFGPMGPDQVMSYQPNAQTQISTDGFTWHPLYVFPELSARVNANQPYGQQPFPPYGQQNYMQQPYGQQPFQPYGQQPNGTSVDPQLLRMAQEKRVLFGVLALLIGTLGVQYFVIGKVGAGILTIVLCLLTCLLLGGWCWIVLIQGIVVLCMSDETFARKFLSPEKTFPIF